jgi:hypothetical protein
MQIDGPTIERFDLPVELVESTVAFTPRGAVVTGIAGESDDQDGFGVAYLLASNGAVTELYREQLEATPIASPIASPVASPMASPAASPESSPSPVTSTTDE